MISAAAKDSIITLMRMLGRCHHLIECMPSCCVRLSHDRLYKSVQQQAAEGPPLEGRQQVGRQRVEGSCLDSRQKVRERHRVNGRQGLGSRRKGKQGLAKAVEEKAGSM